MMSGHCYRPGAPWLYCPCGRPVASRGLCGRSIWRLRAGKKVWPECVPAPSIFEIFNPGEQAPERRSPWKDFDVFWAAGAG